MTPFNKGNTVEQMVPDTLCDGATLNMAAETLAPYSHMPPVWRFVSADALPRLRTIPLSVQSEGLVQP